MTVARLLAPRLRALGNAYAALSAGARLALVFVALATFAAVEETAYRLLLKVDELPVFSAILKWRLLNMTVFSFFYMTVVSAVVTSLGALFAAEDLTLLLASPVPERRIFLAKFAEAVFLSGGVSTLLFLAALVGFARSHGALSELPLAAAAVLPPFLILSGAAGALAALLVARFLPARRVHLLFQGLLALLVVGMAFFFRSLEPERLFRGNGIVTVAAYLRDLGAPASEAEPAGWTAGAFHASFTFDGAAFALNAAKLWAATLLALPLLLLAARGLYVEGVRRTLAAGGAAARGRGRAARTWIERLAPALPAACRAILWKDALLFLRTPVFTSQSLMLVAVGAMYVYNIKLLPLEQGSAYITRGLRDLFGVLNIGMVAFIVASAALRLVFPVLAAEGRALLVLRASPLPPERLLFTKTLLFSLLLLAYAMPLAWITAGLLGPDPAVVAFTLADTALLTPGIVAVNLGCGIHFASAAASSVTDAPGSVGGLAAMAGSVILTAAVVGPQLPSLFPRAFRFLASRHFGADPDRIAPFAAAGVALSAALGLLLPLAPLALARRRLESGEGLP